MTGMNDPVDVLIIGAGASGAAVAWSRRHGCTSLPRARGLDEPRDVPSTGRDWEARAFGDYSPSPNIRARPERPPSSAFRGRSDQNTKPNLGGVAPAFFAPGSWIRTRRSRGKQGVRPAVTAVAGDAFKAGWTRAGRAPLILLRSTSIKNLKGASGNASAPKCAVSTARGSRANAGSSRSTSSASLQVAAASRTALA